MASLTHSPEKFTNILTNIGIYQGPDGVMFDHVLHEILEIEISLSPSIDRAVNGAQKAEF